MFFFFSPCFPFSVNICGDKLVRLTGSFFLLCASVFVIRLLSVVTWSGRKKFSEAWELLPNTFHVGWTKDFSAYFVEENPPLYVLVDYILLRFSSCFSENFLSLWDYCLIGMILCWLYWLFAAAPSVHLIAPLVVKGITQLPHSGVYSGSLLTNKKRPLLKIMQKEKHFSVFFKQWLARFVCHVQITCSNLCDVALMISYSISKWPLEGHRHYPTLIE